MSAIWSLNVALGGALNGDDLLKDFTQKPDGPAFFDGQTPIGIVIPYIRIGESTESRWGTFNTPGHTGVERIHLWGSDKGSVAQMYGHVERILHLKKIDVEGHRILLGTTRMMDSFRDPGGNWHGIVAYEVITRPGA